jgi:predicted  nucleic acid-binding Zn-ribbon protein
MTTQPKFELRRLEVGETTNPDTDFYFAYFKVYRPLPMTIEPTTTQYYRISLAKQPPAPEPVKDHLLEVIENLSVELQQAGNYNTNTVIVLNEADKVLAEYRKDQPAESPGVADSLGELLHDCLDQAANELGEATNDEQLWGSLNRAAALFAEKIIPAPKVDVVRHEVELAQLRERCNELELRRSETVAMCEHLQTELANERNKMSHFHDQMDKGLLPDEKPKYWMQSMIEMQRKLGEQETELAQLREQLATAKAELKEVKTELTFTDGRFHECKDEFADRLDVLQGEVERYKKAAIKEAEYSAKLRDQIDDLSNERNRLTKELSKQQPEPVKWRTLTKNDQYSGPGQVRNDDGSEWRDAIISAIDSECCGPFVAKQSGAHRHSHWIFARVREGGGEQ